MTDRAEVKRLTLQIERGVLARAHLRVLVAAADAALAGHRQALRDFKAQMTAETRRSVRRK